MAHSGQWLIIFAEDGSSHLELACTRHTTAITGTLQTLDKRWPVTASAEHTGRTRESPYGHAHSRESRQQRGMSTQQMPGSHSQQAFLQIFGRLSLANVCASCRGLLILSIVQDGHLQTGLRSSGKLPPGNFCTPCRRVWKTWWEVMIGTCRLLPEMTEHGKPLRSFPLRFAGRTGSSQHGMVN